MEKLTKREGAEERERLIEEEHKRNIKKDREIKREGAQEQYHERG